MPLKEGECILYSDVYPEYKGRAEPRFQSDWETHIDMDKLRRDRHAKLVAEMKKAGVSVMFIANPANLRYATGYHGMGYTTGLAYGLVPVEGELILYGHGTPAIQDRREMAFLKPENIRYAIPTAIGGMALGLVTDPPALKYQREKVVKQIKEDLEELKMAKEVLTFDVYDPGLQALFEDAGIKVQVRGDIPTIAQEVKTKEEIECFRVCASICDTVHWELASYAQPGMTEYELSGYIKYRAMAYGSELDVGGFCTSGEHTWPNFRNSNDKMIRPGDLLYWDTFQVTWNGYHSCYYRTWSVAYKANQKAEDCYKRVNEFTYNALTECKPGNTTWDMVKHWPDESKYWGLTPDICWGDNVMHGLGLINYGPPQTCRAWAEKYPYPLREGQVFAIETQDGMDDGQGVRLENMAVVTKDGCEVLSRIPSDHIGVIPYRGSEQDFVFVPPEQMLEEAKERVKTPRNEPWLTKSWRELYGKK